MLRNILLLAIFAGLAIYLGFDFGSAPIAENAPIVQTVPAPAESLSLPLPEFSFTPWPTGDVMKSTDLKGRVVLINFWASWCAPCVVEFPQLLQLAKAHPDRFTLLAISVDHDVTAMSDFIDRMKDEHPDAFADNGALPANVSIVSDTDKKLAQDVFQTVRFPESILVSPDLMMIRKIVGADFDWLGADFAREIEQLSESLSP